MDDETDTGAYNPDLADTGVSGGTQMPGSEGAAQGDDSMDALPTPPDEGSRKEAKSLWRSIMDAARQQFGIADANANAAADKDANTGLTAALGGPDVGKDPEAQSTGIAADLGGNEVGQVDHAPAGLPKQAGEEQDEVPGQPDEVEPAGLPVQADEGEEDPEAQAYGNPGALPPAAAGRPPDGKNPQRIIQYLTGHGAEDNTQRLAREQETEAQLPPGTDKNTVREEALKQNLAKNGPEGAIPQFQNHRDQYNKFKALAGAAQDHGDMDGAAKLFNEAHTYLPNGAKVTATPGANGGMNINIQEDGTPARDIQLTGNQFRELTHMRVGEFDHVLERGITQNVADLAKTPGMQPYTNLNPNSLYGAPGQTPGSGPAFNTGPNQIGAQAQAQPARSRIILTQANGGPPAKDDQSPEARAQRVYPWLSQTKQRELLAEHYREGDQKQKNTTRALDIKEKLGEGGLSVKQSESERKRDYGTENLNIKREAIAQRDRHLGYLIDKSSGELNERMLHNLDRANGSNMSNAVRSIDANIRAGNPLTDSDKAVLDRARSLAMTPASRPSTLNGGTRAPAPPPASGRGVAPPGPPPIGKNGLPMRWLNE